MKNWRDAIIIFQVFTLTKHLFESLTLTFDLTFSKKTFAGGVECLRQRHNYLSTTVNCKKKLKIKI